MTEEREDGITVEAVEVVVDYDAMFADRLQTIEQMVYEFRHQRGLKEGHEEVGTFAQHRTRETVDFTVRSSHAGHIVIESFGRTVTIDFSSPDESLQIVADKQTSAIEADAAGIFILTDVQRKLVEMDINALD